jgi:hypothetical protein
VLVQPLHLTLSPGSFRGTVPSSCLQLTFAGTPSNHTAVAVMIVRVVVMARIAVDLVGASSLSLLFLLVKPLVPLLLKPPSSGEANARHGRWLNSRAQTAPCAMRMASADPLAAASATRP